MIEAIPLNSDCIVLIITKVEDPEELDTRFSKFAPSIQEDDSLDDMIQELNEGADDVLDLFKRIHEGKRDAQRAAADGEGEKEEKAPLFLTKIYSFDSLGYLFRLSHVLEGFYHGSNSLYKDPGSDRYLLLVSNQSHTPEEFNKLCNCLSEYGRPERSVPGGDAFLQEHCELLIADNALQALSGI